MAAHLELAHLLQIGIGTKQEERLQKAEAKGDGLEDGTETSFK